MENYWIFSKAHNLLLFLLYWSQQYKYGKDILFWSNIFPPDSCAIKRIAILVFNFSCLLFMWVVVFVSIKNILIIKNSEILSNYIDAQERKKRNWPDLPELKTARVSSHADDDVADADDLLSSSTIPGLLNIDSFDVHGLVCVIFRLQFCSLVKYSRLSSKSSSIFNTGKWVLLTVVGNRNCSLYGFRWSIFAFAWRDIWFNLELNESNE